MNQSSAFHNLTLRLERVFYWTFHRKGRRVRHLPRVLRHAGTGVREREEGRVRVGQLDCGGEHAQPRLLPILQRVRHGMADPRGQRGRPHRRGAGLWRALSPHPRRRHRVRGGTLSAQQGSMKELPHIWGRWVQMQYFYLKFVIYATTEKPSLPPVNALLGWLRLSTLPKVCSNYILRLDLDWRR